MEKRNNWKISSAVILVLFFVMVMMNAIANTLRINNITTGDVSDSYPNLFTPAGITFSIWGIIYLLLAIYVAYQMGAFSKEKTKLKSYWMKKIRLFFIISSVANILWILAWHYDYIILSAILMVIVLLSLIVIMLTIKKEPIDNREKVFVKLPFSIYFGWITVATIANVTTLLVSLNWNAFGISEPIMTALIITVGIIIGSITMLRNSDTIYGLTLIWAYTGIIIKHLSRSGFDGQYPVVIITTGIGILVFATTCLLMVIRKKTIF